jgi:hypothetical protein
MRLLIEIFVIGALLYVGWEKPFRDWLPGSKPTNASAAPHQPFNATAAPQSAQSGAWMYDPNRRTALDNKPAPQHSAQPVTTGSGSWMWDPSHHSPLDRPTPRSAATPH